MCCVAESRTVLQARGGNPEKLLLTLVLVQAVSTKCGWFSREIQLTNGTGFLGYTLVTDLSLIPRRGLSRQRARSNDEHKERIGNWGLQVRERGGAGGRDKTRTGQTGLWGGS